MLTYRLEIKKGNVKLPFFYTLLKWAMGIYICWAVFFLLSKSYHLVLLQITKLSEWLAVIVNLLLVALLTRQLLRLNETKYIVVTEEYVKYRKNFPWAHRFNWGRIRKVQLGYSSVRIIVKGGSKYRFSLSRAIPDEQTKLYEVLEQLAKKYGVELMQPI